MLSDLHHEHSHESVKCVKSIMQQKCWILGLHNALKSNKNNFVFCQTVRASVSARNSADLPAERSEYHSDSFTSVGVDYFGPFE